MPKNRTDDQIKDDLETTNDVNPEDITIDGPAVLGKGILNPKRLRPVEGEIGTDAEVYDSSSLDENNDESGEKTDTYDEENDTRLGSV